MTPQPEAQVIPQPEPLPTAAPEPQAAATPEPQATATPEPQAAATPEPQAAATPEPLPTAAPAPLSAAAQAPLATSAPVPLAEAREEPPDTMAPQDIPSPFKRGLRYLFAGDRPSGHKKAACCFIEGYEGGDMNAAYMLCHCYKQGMGVPVKPRFVVQMAEYLVKRGFPPAYLHLVNAYREGCGVPMNLALAAEYSKKLVEMCAAPLPEVHEQVRYDALLHHELQKDAPDMRVLEKLARANFSYSVLPSRYSLLALPLLRDARCSLSAADELQYLLNEGCQADDMGSYYLKGLLQYHGMLPVFPRDQKRGLEYLRYAAERIGTPAALYSYMQLADTDENAARALNHFLSACRWGCSGVKGSDELHCHISVLMPGLPNSGRNILTHSGCILIENRSAQKIQNAVVRICCIDKKLELSGVKLATLAPGESIRINPKSHNLELGRALYVEVMMGELSSRFYMKQEDGLWPLDYGKK